MTDVDDAIQRAEETGWQNASSGEVHQAYADRRILAAEVKRLREVESEVAGIATKMQAIFDDYWASR